MRQLIRYVGDSSPTPPLLYFFCPLPQCLLWPQTLELLAEEAKVVYHLVGKTSWSKVAVNGTHQDAEWTFPWDVRVPFPRKSPPRRIQAERSGTSRKSKWNAHFPFGYSGWECWTASEDKLFISEIFRSSKPK